MFTMSLAKLWYLVRRIVFHAWLADTITRFPLVEIGLSFLSLVNFFVQVYEHIECLCFLFDSWIFSSYIATEISLISFDLLISWKKFASRISSPHVQVCWRSTFHLMATFLQFNHLREVSRRKVLISLQSTAKPICLFLPFEDGWYVEGSVSGVCWFCDHVALSLCKAHGFRNIAKPSIITRAHLIGTLANQSSNIDNFFFHDLA